MKPSADDYALYRAAFMARHETGPTNLLSTVGDALALGAIPIGVVQRDPRLAGAVALAGIALIVGAHWFQPGTLQDEVRSVLRHPTWAARAELGRVLGHR